MKIANTDREILCIFRNDLRNFRKDVTQDNIKSHKKLGFHPLVL